MANLLKALLLASEKAACIARICRQDDHLFRLLVEQKSETEANPRFVKDFKTLADVLIQETVKFDLTRNFPPLSDHIYGEETNKFCNTLGESITVEIQDDASRTALLLTKVLNGDSVAAALLASQIHEEKCMNDLICDNLELPDVDWEVSELAVWIDPIDSTAEYIHGVEVMSNRDFSVSGLQCATVLIGVFNRRTGAPVAGVINQPFNSAGGTRWLGKCYWGVKSGTSIRSSIGSAPEKTDIVCISSSENGMIKDKLKQAGFRLLEVAGAGYKMLTVAMGMADAYVLSLGTTYKWDSCGPHAILMALGGDIYDCTHLKTGQCRPIVYSNSADACNRGGIVAFRTQSTLQRITNVLKEA